MLGPDHTLVNTSDEECALVCMIVSNPGGGERPHAWQKRVNDLIRALRDERNRLHQMVDAMTDKLAFQPKEN